MRGVGFGLAISVLLSACGGGGKESDLAGLGAATSTMPGAGSDSIEPGSASTTGGKGSGVDTGGGQGLSDPANLSDPSGPTNGNPSTDGGDPTSPPDATAVPLSPAGAEMRSLILSEVPPGYKVALEGEENGAVDLGQAAGGDDPSDPQSALLAAGFEAGYQRSWEDASSGESYGYIAVVLYRFGSANGAEEYGRQWISQGTEEGIVSFSVEGVPGARGLRPPNPQDDPYHMVILGRGSYVAAVIVAGPAGFDAELVSVLARRQFALLG